MPNVDLKHASAGIELQLISDFAGWQQVAREWSDLLARLPARTPFQTPEWLFSWWSHFGSGDLQVLAFRNGQRKLVGLIPCFKHEWDGHRQLTLVGSGISDYLEPAIAPEHDQGVLFCLKEYLESNNEWDLSNWQDLSADTPLEHLGSNDQITTQLQADAACSEILIEGCFEDFWRQRPSGLKRNLKRAHEKARRIADPTFTVTHFYDEKYLDALIRLHSARWREQGESGMISANRSAKFLREIAAKFASQDILRLFSLQFQGEITAIILAFAYRNALFGYLSAFDPAYAELGFGRALLHESLTYAFAQGYSSWNFLRGSEPYKADWGARPIPKSRLIVRRVQG